jgi:hypothetical protein
MKLDVAMEVPRRNHLSGHHSYLESIVHSYSYTILALTHMEDPRLQGEDRT